jgi:hypothetical protein
MDLSEKSKPTDHWFSVDYSAATDGLSWKYSGAIFRKIIEDLPYEKRFQAETVLGPHNLHYPVPGRKGVTFKGVQQNGQLMGSILSFPILCLANLGVYLSTTEDSQQCWSDRQRLRHVLINGDDMVYSANPDLWDRHVETAAKVGLEMSVGKAYRHPVYANVNSTSVHYDLRNTKMYSIREFSEQNRGTPFQIDFLNTGLFYGQHKVQGTTECDNKKNCLLDQDADIAKKWNTGLTSEERFFKLLQTVGIDDNEDRDTLVSCLNQLLKGSLPGRQSTLLSKFLTTHKEELKKECLGLRKVGTKLNVFTRNLFLPIPMGGMGVTPPLNFKFRVEKVQREVAGVLAKAATCGGIFKLSSSRPIQGFEVSDLETRKSPPWTRSIAEQQVFGSGADLHFKMPSKKLLSFEGIPYVSNPSYFKIK